jgi:TonB-dependent SusC/RagA subfamily outer membrane receptor
MMIIAGVAVKDVIRFASSVFHGRRVVSSGGCGMQPQREGYIMRCYRCLPAVLSLLGAAACAAGPPPASAPQAQERFEPRIGLSRPPDVILRAPRQVQAEPNQEPLYVVDGVVQEGAPEQLMDNPGDIASVEVIKGEAARARYGRCGENGVILITTRGGGSR